MGGRGSKPVRTLREESEEGFSEGPKTEEDQDEVQTAQDSLGIAAAEQDYPEAAPPVSELPTIPEEEEEAETISVVDDINTKSARSVKPGTDVIIPVQIGTSLQKSLTKTTNDVSHAGVIERRENDADSSITEALMSLSMTSRQNSTLAEQSFNLMHSALEKKRVQTALTQREMLLLERESYEYRKLAEQSHYTNSSATRGQIRRHVSFRDEKKVPKRDVGDVTANEAAELHKQHKAKSFRSLTDDLTSGFRSDAIKVKAILAWICRQSIGRIDFGQARFDPDTPNGYMQLMQEGKGTYPGFFALLCRAAGIKCAIITGISKGAGYEVGSQTTDNLQNAWNAVFVDDGWRLVHPLWVCKSLAGRRTGGWVTIETQGSSRHDVTNGNNGVVTYSYNDYFVFTKPEEFMYRHCPDNPKWQLIPEPIPCETFLVRSYLRPAFFTNEFTLLSEDTCVIASEDGRPVTITIGFPESVASDLVFGYELRLKLDNEDDEASEGQGQRLTARAVENYARFVFVSKGKDRVTFEVRFSKTGVYKLRLFGGLYSEYNDNPPWIMEVKLVCTGVTAEIDPLPFDPGIIGWGPGPIAESLGLFVPSHESSIVHLTYEHATVIHFILKQKMEFDISLRHFRIRPGVLEDHITYEILDAMDVIELRISVTCPNSGEYALKIDVSNGSEVENACNYLVKTDRRKTHETFYQRKSRKLLTEAMMTSDKTILTHALKACEESALPLDDLEVKAGEKRLEYLHCKEEMKTALLVNRIDKSESALYRVQQANLDRLFEREIRRVKHHLKELLSLDEEGWNSRIPEIDRISLMELGQLRQPKQPVRYVVMMLYMLLGVSQETMTDWSQIKLLLRNKDSTLVEMARLENYLDMDSVEIISIDETILERVEEVLQTYSEEDIRKIDNTAAAYYIWVRMVHAKLKQKIKPRPLPPTRFNSMRDLNSSTNARSKSVANVRRHNSLTNVSVEKVTAVRRRSTLGVAHHASIPNEHAVADSYSLSTHNIKKSRITLMSAARPGTIPNTINRGQPTLGEGQDQQSSAYLKKVNSSRVSPTLTSRRESALLNTVKRYDRQSAGSIRRSRPASLLSYRNMPQRQTDDGDSDLKQIPGLLLTGDKPAVRNWTKSYRGDEVGSNGNRTSLSRRVSKVNGELSDRTDTQSRQGGRASVLSRNSVSMQGLNNNPKTENTTSKTQVHAKGADDRRQPTAVSIIPTGKSLTQFSIPGTAHKNDSKDGRLSTTPSNKGTDRSSNQRPISVTRKQSDAQTRRRATTPSRKGILQSPRQGPESITGNKPDDQDGKHYRATPTTIKKAVKSRNQQPKPGTTKLSNVHLRPESVVHSTAANRISPTANGTTPQGHGRLKTAMFRKGTARVHSQTGRIHKQDGTSDDIHRTNSIGSNKDQTFIKNKNSSPRK